MEAPGADPMAELTDTLRKKSEQAAAEQSDEATSFASSTVDNYKTVFHSAFRFIGPPGIQHTKHGAGTAQEEELVDASLIVNVFH